VETAKVSSLRGFQDRRAGGPGGVEHGDHLVFGVGHLGEGERGGSRRRGARPADVGFEGSGAEEGQSRPWPTWIKVISPGTSKADGQPRPST
jgi:hypothetical protein